MKSPKSAKAAPKNRATSRCQFSFADGRHCRMPRWTKHRAFCLPHAREEQRLLALDRLGSELASLSGEFKTVSDVNHVLGNVFTLFAKNRLARRDAVAFAYIGQLLLQSLPGVKREIRERFGNDAWTAALEETLDPPEPRPRARKEARPPSEARNFLSVSKIPDTSDAARQPRPTIGHRNPAPQPGEAENGFDGMAALREVFSEQELSAAGCPPAQSR